MICKNPECDNKFEGHMRQEYCCTKCANRHYYLKRQENYSVEKKCAYEHCRKQFEAKSKNNVFCSRACQLESNRAQLSENSPEARISRFNEKGFEIWDRAHGRVA